MEFTSETIFNKTQIVMKVIDEQPKYRAVNLISLMKEDRRLNEFILICKCTFAYNSSISLLLLETEIVCIVYTQKPALSEFKIYSK